MKLQITLTLPYPPSVNEMYATVGKRRVLVKKGRDFKKAVQKILLVNKVKPNFVGDIMIDVSIYRPRKSGDLDNRLKAIQDALQGFVYKNDSQIVQIYAGRFEDKANPRAVVTIEEI